MGKRGNPAMQKGAPSVNPHGRAAPIAKAAANPAGVDGTSVYSGYVQEGERNSKLLLRNKWVTYSNSMNVAIVATGLRYFGNLLAGTDWHAEPNEAGGKDADRGAEIVTEGLLKAPMRKPWPQVVRKASMYRALGFSLHATAMRRRPDGMIVYSAIEHRPQHTIEQWLRTNESSPFDGVTQRSQQTGKLYPIPLEECLYCVDDTLTDLPEGVGMLRHLVTLLDDLETYEGLERVAYASDMGGTPIGRAPLAELESLMTGKTKEEIKAAKDAMTFTLREVMEKRIKDPRKLAWILLDSAVYKGIDPNIISAIQKFALEIVKSETNGLPDVNNVIIRCLLQIARLLGIEFVMQGGDGKGSYAQHEDKTSMFATNLQTTLNELGWFATNQLARRLVARNGLDPDTCTPTLIAEPISTEAVEVATRSLANLALAGLQPNDPAIPVLRKRMRLPPAPEVDAALVAPRKRAPTPPDDPDLGTEDPTLPDDQQDAPPIDKRRRRRAA